MINLIHYKIDFGQAEWHCHAIAHGKGASDSVGALFKRETARSNLLCKPTDAILSPEKLFSWGFRNISKQYLRCFTEHKKVTRFLKRRFEAISVPDIFKNHSFIVNKNQELFVKRYFNAQTGIKLVYKTK